MKTSFITIILFFIISITIVLCRDNYDCLTYIRCPDKKVCVSQNGIFGVCKPLAKENEKCEMIKFPLIPKQYPPCENDFICRTNLTTKDNRCQRMN